jgi:hypothetical protein
MTARLGFAGATLLLVFSLACGGSSTSPSLTVVPATLTLTAGSTPAGFTATLTGSTSTISWSLTGPGSLSAMTGTTTSYTPPASVTVVTTATVTATAGSLTATVNITINLPPTITVTGNVVAANNLPVVGATIIIGTQNSVSDANGAFSISGVMLPYDLIALSGKFGVVYQQLNLRTPVTVVFPNLIPTLPKSGTVMGNITPTTNIGVADYQTFVAWGSPETTLFSDFDFVQTGGAYSLALSWMGPNSTTGNMHVLQMLLDNTTDLPTSFPGYQVSSGLVVANSGTTTADMTMDSVTNASLSGTISVPASAPLLLNLISFEFADGAMMWDVASDSSGASTFSYTVPPPSTGATTTLLALAESDDAITAAFGSGLMPNTTGVSMTVSAPAEPASPADGGTGVTTATNFVWTPFSSGVHLVTFAPSVSTNPTYYVFTAASTTTIPDLSLEGLGLPTSGAIYSWSITGMAPFATLDAFATGNNYTPFASAFFGIVAQKPPNGVPDFSYSIVNQFRNFTTQ